MEWLESYPWLLAIAIFFARVVDVTLGTVRTILIFRAHKFLAACIGFIEILVWLAAAAQVLKNLDAWYLAAAYAGGFAAGNSIGIWIEGKLALGYELVRVISENKDIPLARALRARSYHVIELAGRAEVSTPVEVLLVVEKRRKVSELLDLIHATDPDAICTISDVKRQVVAAAHMMERGDRKPGWSTARKKA